MTKALNGGCGGGGVLWRQQHLTVTAMDTVKQWQGEDGD